jgi:cbb3-type cytochrome oxidase subunit 3
MSMLIRAFSVFFYAVSIVIITPSLGHQGAWNDVLVILFLVLYPLYIYGIFTKRKKLTLILCILINIIIVQSVVMVNMNVGLTIYSIPPHMLVVLLLVSIGCIDLLFRKNKKTENSQE